MNSGPNHSMPESLGVYVPIMYSSVSTTVPMDLSLVTRFSLSSYAMPEVVVIIGVVDGGSGCLSTKEVWKVVAEAVGMC